MRTNYIGHDELFKLRKAKGWPGWADEETLQSNLQTLQEEFSHDFVPASGQLLELGCGAGGLSLWLSTRGYNVHGIDIAPTAIAWAKEKAAIRTSDATFGPTDFRVGDVRSLDEYSDELFEIVLDGHCLHCIIGDDRGLLLKSAKRVLKPAGSLLLKTMCGELASSHLSVSAKLRDSYDPSTRCLMNEGVATRYIGLPNDIVNEVKAAGFRVVTWRVHRSHGEIDSMDELLLWAKK